MKLDLTVLKKSIGALKDSLDVLNSLNKKDDSPEILIKTVKSGVIQNFEVAYELCWKFMKRWINQNVTPGIGDGISRKELFRLAAENGLITKIENWFEFHISRNLTSHTYDEESVEAALKVTGIFYLSAVDFLARLEARND